MSSSGSSSDGEQDDLLHIYTKLMLDSIDVPLRATNSEAVEPTTNIEGGPKSDGMNAKQRKLEKKKVKREESKRVKADLVEEAEFRLFSKQPIRIISLLPPKEDTRTVPNPRHVPYNKEDISIRRARIRSSVVSGDRVLKSSSLPRQSQSPHSNLFHTGAYPSQGPLPNIFFTDRPKLNVSPMVQRSEPSIKTKRPERRVIPTLTSPYPCDAASTFPLPTFPQTRADQRRQSREKKKVAQRETRLGLRSFETSLSGKTQRLVRKREARFWAPDVGSGGKARGYAYGYAGSAEGARETQGVWVRDKMRKGEFEEQDDGVVQQEKRAEKRKRNTKS